MEKFKGHPWGFFCDHVAVVTAKDGEKENAMPATWAGSVSFAPPLVAVNIGPQRYTHEMVMKTKKFGLCLLAQDQIEISKGLGSCSGKDTEKFLKFNNILKFYGELDVPLIDGCVACMECKALDAVTEGDHTVFTGEVVNVYSTPKKPLLFFKNEYFGIGESKGHY